MSSRLELINDRLPYYYSRKPHSVVQRVLSIIAAMLDTLEGAMEDVRRAHAVDTAWGGSLDYVGGNVGVAREPGESDEAYRNRIRRAIYEQESAGTVDHVKTLIAWFFTGDPNQRDKVLVWNNWDRVLKRYEPAMYDVSIPLAWFAERQDIPFFRFSSTPGEREKGASGFNSGVWKGRIAWQADKQPLRDLLRRITAAGVRVKLLPGEGCFRFSRHPDRRERSETGFDSGPLAGRILDITS